MLVVSLAAFVVAYGGWVVQKLPIDVFPNLNRPTVVVLTESRGMAPEEVETLVTFPVEVAVNGTPGLIRMRSNSGPGLSIIFLEFGWGTDIYRNRQLVSERLQQVRETLPPGIEPIMGPISSIMGEIQLVGLSSPDGTVSPMELRTLADWVFRPRLLSVEGISQVIPIGGEVKQYQVLLNSDKLRDRNISLDTVQNSLLHMSENTTGSFLNLETQEFLIRNLGRVSSIEEIEDSMVGLFLGRPIRVKDVANVQLGPRVKRGDASVNGKPAVLMAVQKQPGTSTIELTEKVAKVLDELRPSLPEGVQINDDLFKQANFIQHSVDNVAEALRDGAILVAIILFLFLLNFRTTFITLTAIPLSLLVTAIIFHLFGLGINTMTLGGLAVAIGELVDDAIVDVENVFRRLKQNRQLADPKPILKVVFEASSEIRNSIVFATIIVVLVFIPLFSLSGLEGRFFAPLGIAYVVSLVASLFVSLTVTPVLCSLLLPSLKQLKSEADGALVRFIKKWDEKVLRKALDHPRLVVGSFVIAFLMSLAMIPFFGKEFLPQFNEGTAMFTVTLRPGVSLEYSNEIGRQAEELIKEVPEVVSVSRRTGRAELDEHAEGVHNSEIDVDFKHEGRPRGEVLEVIRKKLVDALPGVFVNVGQPISHRLDHLLSGVRAQIAIKIFGPDLGVLRSLAARTYDAIRDVPGLVDVAIERQVLIPQLKIYLLRDEVLKNRMVTGKLTDHLEMALEGKVSGQVLEGQRFFDILMRLDKSSRDSPEEIRKIPIATLPDGNRVRLEEVADVYESEGPNIINRENMQRRIVVQSNVSGRDLGSAVDDLKAQIEKKVDFPEGYYITYGGQFKNQQEASRSMIILGAISLLGIFLVLYGHFGSVFITLQIMFNIPQALIGSVIAVYFSDRILSIASMVGFVTLCGIASRNGIMMISHYLNLMKEEGMPFDKEMVVRGTMERLVPVLMTALTAVLALIPLVLSKGEPGKEILHPVAVIIVGGLLSSTILDMWLTPTVFYRYGRKSAEAWLKKNNEGNRQADDI